MTQVLDKLEKSKAIDARLARARDLLPEWKRHPSKTKDLLADELRDLLLEIEGHFPGHSMTARTLAISDLTKSGIELSPRLAITQLEAMAWWGMVTIGGESTLPIELAGAVRQATHALRLALQRSIGLPNAGATFSLRAVRRGTGRNGCELRAYGVSPLGRVLRARGPLGNKAFVLLRTLWERRRRLSADADDLAVAEDALKFSTEDLAERMRALGGAIAKNEKRARDLKNTTNELRKKLGCTGEYRHEFIRGDRRKGDGLYLGVPHTAVEIEDHVVEVEQEGPPS